MSKRLFKNTNTDWGGLIPAGNYFVVCTHAEQRITRAGNGTYIRTQFLILGPTHNNRRIYAYFNINNPSVTAEKIGLKKLNKFITAAGLDRSAFIDDQQLVGLSCIATISTRFNIKLQKPMNEITGYTAIPGRRVSA